MRAKETDLRKAIAYLHDLDAELEERSAVRGLQANSPAHQDMLYQLDHARNFVALLERQVSAKINRVFADGSARLDR